jgi:hypothetical protein
MTAASVTAIGLKIIRTRQATQLKSLGHIGADRLLQLVHFLLCFHEASGDGIVNECLALLLKLRDFIRAQGRALSLLVLKIFSSFAERLVLLLRLIVGHENVDLPANALKFRLVENGLAEFLRLLDDHGIFSYGLHSNLNDRLPRVRSGSAAALQ